jgi:pimeloyl-ACP methyl ester carboxylesterase
VSEVPVRFDQSFVHEGSRLFYDVYGTGDQVIVYTHGLLLDSQLNRGIAEALAEHGHRVVLLDLLGHGRSDQPPQATRYRIDRYADQIVGLLDHLGLEQAVLGGLSLGANVSLFTAARYPERVRALVLEMPVLERAVPAAALMFAPMILLAHYGRPFLHLTAGLFARVPRTRFGPLNSVLGSASLPPETMAAVLHGVLVGPVAPTVEQRRAIAAPTLVLAHRNDLIHPFDDAANLVEELPHAVLVRARSPLELRLRPQRLTHELVAFLDELARTTPTRHEAPTGTRPRAVGGSP